MITKKNAMIILHEIYGVNAFIKDQCHQYKQMGFDVSCPNLINRKPFSYHEVKQAYETFMLNVGFDYYHEINDMICQLKEKYEKVVVVGFSAGATLAWRCCENQKCDGLIACYGSRIRDYTELNPNCPVLLLTARESAFDINEMIVKLQNKGNMRIIEFDADHGFLDAYSSHYDESSTKKAEEYILKFISDCCK